MFKIVDRYIGWNVNMMVIYCTLGLLSLNGLIKYVDALRHVGQDGFGYLEILWYILYTIPGQLIIFFPLGVLLGVVIALGNLASSSELIVIQAIGKSKLSIVFSACFSLIPLILFNLFVAEFVMPNTEKMAEDFYTEKRANGQVAVTSSGVWFKENNSFILIDKVLINGTLEQVTRYTFSEGFDQKLQSIERAKEGRWVDDTWVMTDIDIDTFTNHEIEFSHQDESKWNLLLTPEKVSIVGVDATDLSIRGLVDYISYMNKNKQNTDRYLLVLYRKVIHPFMLFAVILLAASTVFGPLRSSSMGARVVFGIVVGFIFYAINEILAPFTIMYGFPPIIGALLPTLIVFIVGVLLLRRKV